MCDVLRKRVREAFFNNNLETAENIYRGRETDRQTDGQTIDKNIDRQIERKRDR